MRCDHTIMRKKFIKVPEDVRRKAINDYLCTNLTTKQIGFKYGFNHRRLRQWFINDDRLSEFEKRAHQNTVGFNKLPKDNKSITKISGFRSISWKGKKLEVRNGVIRTILIPAPNHPDANKNGYIPEHRLVMEKKIKRRLKKEEIPHHIDLNPSNNKSNNLLLIDNSSEHAQLHHYLQLALVQLMPRKDLARLTRYLVKLIKKGDGPLRYSSTRKGGL